MYLQRKIDAELAKWRTESTGKPLLIRGARQTGKSTAVRHLAKQFDHFLEINFEQQKTVHKLFEEDLDPLALCESLTALYQVPIIPGKTLLFFDEIQACIPAISSLRYFYEKYPQLHLIAAGSLLEFAIAEIPSFGVGRVRSLFMYPLSFDEYLDAMGEHALLMQRKRSNPAAPLPEPIHLKLVKHLKRFLIIGGMPEVIVQYIIKKDINVCAQILDDLMITLKADFAKYKKRIPSLRISEVFDSVVAQSGARFVYANAATQANHHQIKEAVELLVMAGLVIPVTHTSANGIPLGAESNPKKRKMLLLDTGIFQRILKLNVAEILLEDDFDLVNRGTIAEQFAGLELLKSSSPYRQEDLYYWHREAKSSNAEVDYLITIDNNIIPLEVKSGKKGTMQSLRLFMYEKNSPYGIRLSLENFAEYEKIKVYPLYSINDIKPQPERSM